MPTLIEIFSSFGAAITLLKEKSFIKAGRTFF
jgi:hypothetical protein